MRKFFSYGPIDSRFHYYVPRSGLIAQALGELTGETGANDGHYITIWAPRQTGKTWIMQQVLHRLRNEADYQQQFIVAKLNLEYLKLTADVNRVAHLIGKELIKDLGLQHPGVNTVDGFYSLFERDVLQKPLILILDEFDALSELAISSIASVFRNIYIRRQDEQERPSDQKSYLLHGLALIGVRSVMGIENQRGSPFNVQHSLHIPNLSRAEVGEMFDWYTRESGQGVAESVVERVYNETNGQPGLVSWLGELLTQEYQCPPDQIIDPAHFETVYTSAIDLLPNSNILNIISKAKQEPYQETVLELFKTAEKMPFRYDNPHLNFLYMNGVISWEQDSKGANVTKFACPLIQKRLFNYFAYDLAPTSAEIYDPFDELTDVFTPQGLNITSLLRRYESYFQANRQWILQDVPLRSDLRPYEAIYHFNLYTFLVKFLQRRQGQVIPEFPTGNGQIDLILRFEKQVYALELKSYVDSYEYRNAVQQALRYAQTMHLQELWLVFFVQTINNENRQRLETTFVDMPTNISIHPIFIATSPTP